MKICGRSSLIAFVLYILFDKSLFFYRIPQKYVSTHKGFLPSVWNRRLSGSVAQPRFVASPCGLVSWPRLMALPRGLASWPRLVASPLRSPGGLAWWPHLAASPGVLAWWLRLVASPCSAGCPETPAQWHKWVSGGLLFGFSLRFGALFAKGELRSAI